MATVTVRVVPRSGRSGIEARGTEVVIRVRATPEAGRANDEARRVLAEALGVAASRVRLRTGARSRSKTFEVQGLTPGELRMRLGET